MSEMPREWKYLERRPGSSYRQLCIKGKRIWAWTLYCEFMSEKEPRTPESLFKRHAAGTVTTLSAISPYWAIR